MKASTKKIAKFSWSDEETKVKIYIELNQFRGKISESMVSVSYDEFECNIEVMDEDDVTNVLNLYKLYEKIEPEKSTVRWSAKRITITLHKWLETSWKELTRVPGKGDKKK